MPLALSASGYSIAILLRRHLFLTENLCNLQQWWDSAS